MISEKISYKVRGFFGRLPSEPHQLTDRITPTERCIVLCHLGVLDVAARDDWELEVGGLVERPGIFNLGQLKRFPKSEIVSVHQCAGSPLTPEKPSQRVCNVRWGGLKLDYLLELMGVRPEANFIWSHGADSGEFAGVQCGDYVKDLPLSRAASDVLLAYEMNGSELLPEHGFPLRLVVPGFYGTNSVKWLRKIELRSERAPGPFTTRWYNDPEAAGASRPVWEIAPQSVIVWPSPGTELKRGERVQVWGWAWADDGIAAVELSSDGGRTWQRCQLESADERAWIKFTCDWIVEAGCIELTSRATSRAGQTQPPTGRRNAFYHVPISAG
jgi:DMSO/TMAO reductase YedYZ molybdopterin-dependent catalytic subunit